MFGLELTLVVSRESSQINGDLKLADGRGEVVSSASNNYLDGACEMSSRLIVELPDVPEDCSEEETKINLLSYFFVKIIPLSRRAGYVTDGWISGSVDQRCMYVTPIRLDLL